MIIKKQKQVNQSLWLEWRATCREQPKPEPDQTISLEGWDLPFSQEDILKQMEDPNNQIGSGNFAEVFKVFEKYAVKRMNLSQNNLTFAEKEMKILKKIRNPFSVKYFGAFGSKSFPHIVIQYAKCGSLAKIISKIQTIYENATTINFEDSSLQEAISHCFDKSQPGMPENILSKIFCQVLMLMYFLKKKCILHRDIKPDNIFLTEKGIVKVGDYGLAKESDKGIFVSSCGSSAYLPPEKSNEEKYSYPADIWSMAISLVETAMGEFIFDPDGLTQCFLMMKYIPDLQQELPIKMAGKSEELINFAASCLKLLPAERLTAEELLEMPFITKYNEKWLIEKYKDFEGNEDENEEIKTELESHFSDVAEWLGVVDRVHEEIEKKNKTKDKNSFRKQKAQNKKNKLEESSKTPEESPEKGPNSFSSSVVTSMEPTLSFSGTKNLTDSEDDFFGSDLSDASIRSGSGSGDSTVTITASIFGDK